MYKTKYLKYKKKYLEIKLFGGAISNQGEIEDINGNTPLMIKCKDEFNQINLEIITQLLTDSNIDVNHANNKGDTALIIACKNRSRDQEKGLAIITQLLANPNIDVNYANKKGDTALIIACKNGSINQEQNLAIITQLLTKPNIDVNRANNESDTALIIVCRNIYNINNNYNLNYESSQQLQKQTLAIITQLLANSNIDVNYANARGNTAYLYACYVNDTIVSKLLIKHGADSNIRNEDNQQCIIPITDKTENLVSVTIKRQQYGDCFAHAIARHFVRFFQLFEAFASKYNEDFYYLFYFIIIQKFGCDGAPILDSFKYLLDFLNKNLNKIFEIEDIDTDTDAICTGTKCEINYTGSNKILKLEPSERQHCLETMDRIIPELYIIDITYNIRDQPKNNPIREIKELLEYKFQPVISFIYSINLYNFDDDSFYDNNLVPLILNKDSDNKNCESQTPSHAINLRSWTKEYVDLKNSWGRDRFNNGNFTIEDIKQLSCNNDSNNKTPIFFTSLIFDQTSSTSLTIPKNSYYQTIPQNIDIDENIDSHHQIDKIYGYNYKQIPLIAACNRGNLELVRELLKNGADINTFDVNNNTLLLIACENNNIDIVKLLLEKGANIEQHNNKGTPLLIACEMNHVDIVKLLLEKGANKYYMDVWGQTALDIATDHDNTKIIALLNSV